MKFQLVINIERNDDRMPIDKALQHTLDMVKLADGEPVIVSASIEDNFKITPRALASAILLFVLNLGFLTDNGKRFAGLEGALLKGLHAVSARTAAGLEARVSCEVLPSALP